MRFPNLALGLALSAISAISPSVSAAAGVPSSSYASPWGIGIARSRAFSSAKSISAAATSTFSRVPRGGADSTVAEDATSTPAGVDGEEKSLDEKVREAMKKYGLNPDVEVPVDDDDDQDVGSTEMNCEGGVCEMPSKQEAPQTEEDINEMADRIADELDVDRQIVMAALGATATGEGDYRRVDETLARELIVAERDAISGVTEDCDEVKQLVSEGHDPLLSRRALAFADMQIDDARAILLAEQEDEQAEREAQAAYEEEQARLRLREEMEAKKEAEANMKEIKVDANFDPTQPAPGAGGMNAAAAGLGLGGATGAAANSQGAKPDGMPGPAKREDVVFDITTDQIQEIIMESPVPVLLDVYADWCGPCKALAPALEQMAVKAGGMFRLVKLNSDNERSASQALEVKALPTVFGIRDGKIVNMFQGMPRDEEMMRNFMMGLMVPGTEFNPPVTAEQKKEFAVLSTKLTKVAGSASFPFCARERLQDRTVARLDELVQNTNMADAEEAAKTIRTLLSNVIRDPYETKFRKVNLANKVIAARVASQPSAVAILKSVGFGAEEGDGHILVIGKGKKAVNVAPLLVARDCIDKWIDKNRYEIAKAARLKRDELERARLAAEAELEDEYDSEEEEEEEQIDPDACTIRLRIDGKKKVHDLAMRADNTLSSLVDKLPGGVPAGEEVQITCTARRLIVKSSDTDVMNKTLRELKLMPSASVAVKIGSGSSGTSSSSLAERAKARQERKKGEHTMASVGIYSKDDNAKGELIDGGGGVWYEHDVTSDDEAEENQDPIAEDQHDEESGDEVELEESYDETD